jgi:mono/diheme cytochrome c family protein
MRVSPTIRNSTMRLSVRTACVCVLFAALASSAVGTQLAAAPQASPASKLFTRFCIQCHGTDGKGDPGRKTLPTIPDFTDGAWQKSRSDVQLRISILEGKDQHMPSNRGQITEAQAGDLMKFVRTFGPAAPATATPKPDPTPIDVGNDTVGSGDLAMLFKEFAEQKKQLMAITLTPTPPPVVKPVAPVTPTPAQTLPPPTPKIVKRSVSPGAAEFFGQMCAGCHTIGAGSLTGPDLKNVSARKDRDWLISYMQNPKAAFDSGDAYALHLLAEARGVVMPKPFGMNREKAESVLELIDEESKLEKSRFAGPPVSDAPFKPGNAERGRELFIGKELFANGGASCVTCHTAYGLGRQEGGKLGPELTKAYERLGGRASLTARLWSPATPTMLPVYKDHPLELDEVMCLVAYLEQEAKEGVEQSSAPPIKFFLLGLGGTVLALAAASFLLGSRFGMRPAPGP